MDDDVKYLIKMAAKLFTGAKRRRFEAEVSEMYFNSSPRKTETEFGWDRKTVELGLNEKRSGFTCVEAFHLRGNKKTEEKLPDLEENCGFFGQECWLRSKMIEVRH